MDNYVPQDEIAIPASNSNPSMAWVYILALVLAIGAIGGGVYVVLNFQSWALLASGVAGLIGVLVAWPLAAHLGAHRSSSSDSLEKHLRPVMERFEQFSVMLDMISEQQLISDRAKAVAFREKDRDAIRRAIQEEISRQDWEAALALCKDMETSFGYRQEAEVFRQDVFAKRQKFVQKHVTDAATIIDKHTKAEQWNMALREAERLMAQYPEDERVQNLPNEIEARRQAHKRQLFESWNDAVFRKDVDGSIEILKKLDLYVTPEEAVSLQESARGVIKEKIGNLRTQFSLAVQEHKWAEAVRIGDMIVHDFPNTQMAKEVRDKMDALRQRAGNHSASKPEPAAV